MRGQTIQNTPYVGDEWYQERSVGLNWVCKRNQYGRIAKSRIKLWLIIEMKTSFLSCLINVQECVFVVLIIPTEVGSNRIESVTEISSWLNDIDDDLTLALQQFLWYTFAAAPAVSHSPSILHCKNDYIFAPMSFHVSPSCLAHRRLRGLAQLRFRPCVPEAFSSQLLRWGDNAKEVFSLLIPVRVEVCSRYIGKPKDIQRYAEKKVSLLELSGHFSKHRLGCIGSWVSQQRHHVYKRVDFRRLAYRLIGNEDERIAKTGEPILSTQRIICMLRLAKSTGGGWMGHGGEFRVA